MAYLKPPAFVSKVFNPLAMTLGIGGSTVLAVPRRRSGTTQKIPVIPVEHDGARYVVSTRGESEWVRNLRAAGRVELGGKPFSATEIAVAERDPVIAAYRAKAGRTVVTYWKQLPDAADHPTFRLEPLTS
jgi:crotonobetainyl-CoA:carnitine CoA-transferase CaiB-like acyl-CoA transferase